MTLHSIKPDRRFARKVAEASEIRYLCTFPRSFFFFKILFIHLTQKERERQRIQARGVAEGEGEADSLLSREPDVGLHPRTLKS